MSSTRSGSRWASVALATVLVCGGPLLAACGGDGDSDAPSSPTAAGAGAATNDEDGCVKVFTALLAIGKDSSTGQGSTPGATDRAVIARAYRTGATTIRQVVGGQTSPELKTAATDVANTLDGLAPKIEASPTPPVDQTGLSAVGTRLMQYCQTKVPNLQERVIQPSAPTG